MKRAKLLRIGIVGCGAIGSSLAEAINNDFRNQARLCGLYDIVFEKSLKLALKLRRRRLAYKDAASLMRSADLIIEATHADFSYNIARQAILEKCDVMIMSVGGILRKYKELSRLAKRHQAKVYVPSGAISGLDAVKASSISKIKSVTLTTIKPVTAFGNIAYISEKKINLNAVRKEEVIFQGSALEATKYFPQNVNVAAALSLAGIGPQKTKVRIIASALARRNTHEIEVVSQAGKIMTRTENVIHPENPKTSYLAVLSAIANLKQILQPVRIGT